VAVDDVAGVEPVLKIVPGSGSASLFPIRSQPLLALIGYDLRVGENEVRRTILSGIVCRLRTGSQWKALPARHPRTLRAAFTMGIAKRNRS
jgi:hypothetical protein